MGSLMWVPLPSKLSPKRVPFASFQAVVRLLLSCLPFLPLVQIVEEVPALLQQTAVGVKMPKCFP
eukprot:7971290-Prorocentrum_lima.AAC.1